MQSAGTRPDQTDRRRTGAGRAWDLRPATEADNWLLRELAAQRQESALCPADPAASLRSAFETLRVLHLDGAAVGLCGVEDVGCAQLTEAPLAIAFRMVVLVVDGLAANDAAEAADRLIEELARCVGLPLSVTDLRATSLM